MFTKLYGWINDQARSKHAQWVLFVLAFAESSVFPIPPDVLLIALVLLHREKWFRYFFICLVGSVLGGMGGYLIGHGLWETVGPWFLNHVFSETVFNRVRDLYHHHDFWVVFVAAFTPIPYKVFTIAAGVAQIHFLPFVAASIIGRGGRFIIVAALLYHFGPSMKVYLEKYFGLITIVFSVLLIGGFYFLKHVLH